MTFARTFPLLACAGVLSACMVRLPVGGGADAGSPGAPSVTDGTCTVRSATEYFTLDKGVAWTIDTKAGGGFCGITLNALQNGAAYDFTFDPKPAHGEARARSASPKYYVEYRPAPGFVGTDQFAFRLLPGNGYFPVTVNVAP